MKNLHYITLEVRMLVSGEYKRAELTPEVWAKQLIYSIELEHSSDDVEIKGIDVICCTKELEKE